MCVCVSVKGRWVWGGCRWLRYGDLGGKRKEGKTSLFEEFRPIYVLIRFFWRVPFALHECHFSFYLTCQLYSVMRCLRYAIMVNSMPVKCLCHISNVLRVIGLLVWVAVRTACSLYAGFCGFHCGGSALRSVRTCESSDNATCFISPKKEGTEDREGGKELRSGWRIQISDQEGKQNKGGRHCNRIQCNIKR